MSQIPRRTIEIQHGSARKSTRSTLRPSSTIPRPSTSANARPSARISAATPQRTPLRTPIRTSSRDRNTMIPMTAEKEKAPVDDKETIHAYSLKILQELSEVGGFNELVQKGFKAMTIKQFAAILQHFFQPIFGRMPLDFSSTYIDKVPILLNNLEYPYVINKSSLKTPNAPHCLNSTIVLLSWLQDLRLESNDPLIYDVNKLYHNQDAAIETMEKMYESFKLWNSNQLETDQQASDMVLNVYRSIHLKAEYNLTLDINRIKGEIEQLSDGNKPVTLAKELNDKLEVLNSLEQKIGVHEDNITELSRKKENAQAELLLKRMAEKNVQTDLKRLQNQLSHQRITKEDRHQLLVQITHMKSALISKKNAVNEIREASSENEITLSNLISAKFQLIDRLNNMIYKISSDLKIAGIKESFNVDELVIDSTKDDDCLRQNLDYLTRGMNHLKESYLDALTSIKQNILELENENSQLKTENDLLVTKLNQLKSTLEQLTIEENNLEMECKIIIQNTDAEHQSHKEKLEMIKRDIEERTKGIEQLKLDVDESKEKKSSFGAKAVKECEHLYEERKKEVEYYRKILDENNAIINDYNKNNEPLPDNLQNTLDNILKKKRAEKET